MGPDGQVGLPGNRLFTFFEIIFFFFRSVTDDLISESFVQDQRFLKYRSLILRSIAASFNLLNGKNGIIHGGQAEETTGKAVILESLINQLQEHHDQVLKEEVNYKALDSPIQGPYRSRLSLYVKHGQLMIAMFRGVASLYLNHASHDLINKAGQMYFSVVQEVLEKGKPSQLVREDFFEDILNTIEVTVCSAFFRQEISQKYQISQKFPLLSEWQRPLSPLQRLPKNNRSFA